MPIPSISQRIADELSVREAQVAATVRLLDEGATVPFIARYRKEATGGLDDTQLRNLEERLAYLRELEERRTTILESIRAQDKLTDALAAAIAEAETKTRLEDLYLPYRPKRRTKAQIAREAGLEPLADLLLNDPTQVPEAAALDFIDAEKGVADLKSALEGARQILMERWSEDATLIGRLRTFMLENGRITARVIEEKKAEGAKFADYFDFSEPLRSTPSHRALAMFRGRSQGILDLGLAVDNTEGAPHPAEEMIARHVGIADLGRPADSWLKDSVRWAWKAKISLHIETDLFGDLRERAEDEAIKIFARNLHDLLLAAPAGPRPTMGLDPGIRTGVKVAVMDATGKLLETAVVYPHQPKNDWDGALAELAALAAKHKVELVSIGNGTASRETDALVNDLMQRFPNLRLLKLVVSEAGASVYSASEIAALEFPELDVTLRGAVSIGRRLQDPLAELVKIDPKSIGVGQYQHDVAPQKLARSLDAVVEDCVNAVGVDLNTASVPLLARVSGLNESVARNIVNQRNTQGPFQNRRQLLDVSRLGAKTFELAAGFLRIREGDNALDASAVHPESYPVVERILKLTGRELSDLIGDVRFLRSLHPEDYTDAQFGVPTVADILRELEKPGRDPRPEFKTAIFKEGVHEIKDLKPGMLLEGVITNVTAFGAFADVGVHQDGLIHISQLSNSFVRDPHAVVKAGDIVRVKVMDIDVVRRRIALTMRLDETPAGTGAGLPPSPPAAGKGTPAGGPRGNKSDFVVQAVGPRAPNRSEGRNEGKGNRSTARSETSPTGPTGDNRPKKNGKLSLKATGPAAAHAGAAPDASPPRMSPPQSGGGGGGGGGGHGDRNRQGGHHSGGGHGRSGGGTGKGGGGRPAASQQNFEFPSASSSMSAMAEAFARARAAKDDKP